LTDGTGNTAIGYQAGDAITTGTGNTVIGVSADVSGATGTNELAIWTGAGALITGDGDTPEVTISGNLTIDGAVFKKRTDGGAGDYNPSALTSDYLITVDNSGAARAITISTEDIATGSTSNPRFFLIKDEEGAANTYNITVSGESGTIDGAASLTISTNYGAIMLYADGTNLFVY